MSELTTEQRERVEDFIGALRSGEYRQTSDQLGFCDGGKKSYCCEGIAVERYGEQLGYVVGWENNDLVLNEMFEYAQDSFWHAVGLGIANNGSMSDFAFVLPEGQTVRNTGAVSEAYMALNDDGFTFAQIADLIEWQFLTCPQH